MTTDQTRRTVLTVTVTTRPDGGHYFDQADFIGHVTEWVRAALKGQHAVDDVTIAAASVPPPADRATLRDRIAEALYERERPPRDPHWPDVYASDREVFEAMADAVLAVLPQPADRGATTVCICGHPEQQHFEDVCITEITGCDCGDYLEPEAAREVIARWRQAALQARATDRAAVLRDFLWRLEQSAGDAAAEKFLDDNPELRRVAAEEQPAEPAEDPARIDRIRPEFTEHASVESIDVQLRRARSQQRRWHLRVEWLISLRQARVEQKGRGEWPAVGEQPETQEARP